MKCPKCGFENLDKAKFCNECGNKLEISCPNCSTGNQPGSKFCYECGLNLTTPSEPPTKELSFDEKIDKIQRYLPKGLTDKVLSQRDKIEGERKQVTVMFCDMEGFTALVERIGPEEAYSTMDQIYEILIHKVHDYEGTVNEMTGDGIMALFGAPIALEDGPQRAIRSSLAIHRAMVRFSDRIKQEKEDVPPIKMRIGLHTGPVIVGTLGNDLRVEFKAVGDTVNLASRMEGLAEPGTTYVTEGTFRLTEGFFRYEALGEKVIRGKEEPVKAFRVIVPSTRRTKFDVSAERGLTPFVGRERELELLLDAFERVKAGRGQAISIMSEAGVGKSRLLYEFRKAVANENATFLEGKCLSYSRGVAYHPVIDILKSNFDLQEGEGDSEIRQKVGNGLKVLGADKATTLPYLLELLSVKDSGIDKILLSPEGKKDQILETLKRIVLKGSEIRPLIMAFEDLHWVDKSSENLLKYLLESIPIAAVFLIFTYRTEFVQTWGAKSFQSQITLNRLSNRESIVMVTHILGTEDLDRNLEELILEKTEGVPFFIEEFIRSLKNLKIIEMEDNKYSLAKGIERVTIPSTIKDVIMARVDTLPEGAKDVLQTGSVIEREFSYDLIKRVTCLSEQELLSHLSTLKDSELLYERGIYPLSSYVFRHALTRELVYDSILSRRRKKLHEKIGHAMESLFKENLDEHYGLLAEHYIDSENYEKGAEYSKLAGKRAQKKSAFNDAISYANKAIFCLESLPKTVALQRKVIDARTVLAWYFINLNYHIEAKEAVDPIFDLALEMKYQKRLPAIYTAMGTYYAIVAEELLKGVEYLEKALELSEELGDVISLWFASYFLGWHVSWNCKYDVGFNYLKKCLDLSKLANNSIGIISARTAMCVSNYLFKGKIDLAYQETKKCLSIGEETGDTWLKGMVYTSHGTSCYFKGLTDEAENNLLHALAFCEKTGHLSWGGQAAGFLGHIYYDKGEYEKAEHYYGKAISILKPGRIMPSWINMWEVLLSRAKILNRSQVPDLNRLFKYHEKVKVKILEGWTARYIGEIMLNMGYKFATDADKWIRRAIEADKRNGTMWLLANDYVVYARLTAQKDNQSKAKENLAKAIDIFKECGADGWVEKYEKELAELS